MTTPPTGGPGSGWSVPETGAASSGWGPPPGAPAPGSGSTAPGQPGRPAQPGQPAQAQGWGQMTGPGQQPYGSVLTRRGIIALKPLGFGDFFDGGFRAIRHNPRAMIGLSALVLGVTNILVALPLVGVFSTTAFTDPTAELTDDDALAIGGSLLALIPTGFLQSIAVIVLTGMLILSVTQSVVDRRLSIGQLWHRARGRVWPLIGWSLLQSVGLSLLVALALAPGIVLLVLQEFAGGAAALVLLGIGVFVLSVWLGVKLLFVPVLIVVERLGIVASVKRSWTLTRGAFWWTLLLMFLTVILTSIVSQVLATPFAFVGALGLTLLESDPLLGAAVYAGAVSLGTTVGLVLSVPFLAAVIALLYVDRRIRLEGLDVALARTLEDEQA
ncbi:hypothetical protein [Aquipuribacter sp. MA13-6]|uniref:hypothetical protein n=1 Tax=unclassified Aquipuribacter TaxID=2635084 RepID=UPI003EEA7634